MSDPEDVQALITGLSSLQVSVRTDHSMTALLVYDWVLTFALERQYIWKAKKSLVFYLFVGVRYSRLLNVVFESLADIVPISLTKWCNLLFILHAVSDLVAVITLAGVFIIRAYAICQRSKAVLYVLSFLALARVVMTSLSDANQPVSLATDVIRNYAMCLGDITSLGLRFSMTDAICALTFDTLVLVITLFKTAQQVYASRNSGEKHNLTYYVLRDGIFYYVAIELWTIAGLTLDNMPSQSFVSSIIGGYDSAVSCILAQRLLLNLRQVEEELSNPTHPTQDLGELCFAHGSVLGNIGAPLRDGADDGAMTWNEREELEIGQTINSERSAGLAMAEFGIEEVLRKP